MKNIFKIQSIVLVVMLLNIASSRANWIKSENNYSPMAQEINSQEFSRESKSDSLPYGVTQEWLNALTDENGNRILSENPENDALQKKFFDGFVPGGCFGYSVSSAGDVNNDGFFDVFVTGYKSTDMNGDYITDLTDVVLTYNNSSNFVSIKKP